MNTQDEILRDIYQHATHACFISVEFDYHPGTDRHCWIATYKQFSPAFFHATHADCPQLAVARLHDDLRRKGFTKNCVLAPATAPKCGMPAPELAPPDGPAYPNLPRRF